MKRALAALILSAISVCAAPPRGGHRPPPPPPTCNLLQSCDWTFEFGSLDYWGHHPNSLPNGQSGWWFDMPILVADISTCWPGMTACEQVDYILAPFMQDLLPFHHLQLTVQIVVTSGNPVFNYQTESYNTCTFPAHVRPMIWWANDPVISSDYGRWWANPIAVELSATTGTQTIQVPIDPSQWTSVYGERGTDSAAALAGWQAAFSAPKQVALTFGGGCFFGHGVNISGGTAQFVVLDYSFH